MWRNRYELTADGQPVATWDGGLWRRGTIDLAGRPYAVTSNVWGSRFEMTDQVGLTVATADRVGRRRWTVTGNGRSYEFQRPMAWRSEELLLAGGQPVGSVRRGRAWRSDAVADLPGLPMPLQVFVVIVVLTMWNARSASTPS